MIYYYIDLETEDYEKTAYDGIYTDSFEEGTGHFATYVTGDQDNLYYMEDNPLIFGGYSAQEFSQALYDNDLGSVGNDYFAVTYTPLTLTAQTRLWVELGDRVVVTVHWWDLDGNERELAVTSLVLSREISGIQALEDVITANGENVHYTEDDFTDE